MRDIKKIDSVLEMLYDYDTKLFIQQAIFAYDFTYGTDAFCNYFHPSPYPSGPYVIPPDCEAYLQTVVPKHKIIERLLAVLPNFGIPNGLEQIVQTFSSNYSGMMDEIVFKYYNECNFRSCAQSNYELMSDTDSTEIFNYLKEEKWTGILQQVRGCYKDSFNYNFAKTYPGFVAEIFENWHYPLVHFMDSLSRTYFGNVEDYFDTTMRDKIDGDTLIDREAA